MLATVRQLLAAAKPRLHAAPHAPSGREAHLLLGHVLGWSEAQVLARDDRQPTAAEAADFEALLVRRLAGEPVAYLTGRREFYGRSFAVDSRVLIPRPETEHLVAAALAWELPPRPQLLDVATGSGCVGITLALERAAGRVLLTDNSAAALAVARTNAHRLNAARVTLLCTDWAAGVDLAAVDLVTANPPYIAPGEAAELSSEITGFEPAAALFAAEDGLAAYGDLLASLAGLRPGTPVLLEIGQGQAPAIAALASERGFDVARVVADYAGIDRVVVVIRSEGGRSRGT